MWVNIKNQGSCDNFTNFLSEDISLFRKIFPIDYRHTVYKGYDYSSLLCKTQVVSNEKKNRGKLLQSTLIIKTSLHLAQCFVLLSTLVP